MKRTTLEKAGISSAKVKEYIELLEREGLSTHDIIIARRGEIAFETYWKPFHEKFNHRMYSVTKSYVIWMIPWKCTSRMSLKTRPMLICVIRQYDICL